MLTLSALALAMLALYLSAKAAFRQAERAAEPEPSIMTELDMARSEIAFLRKDREAILREYRRLQVRIEEAEKTAMPAVDFTKRRTLGWVTADMYGGIIGHEKEPSRKEVKWVSDGYWCAIAPEEAYRLCGRVPEWSDEDPTPVKK